MKTNKYIIMALLAGVMIPTTSCSDFFDSDSKAVIKTDGQQYNNEQDARSGLFGLLQGLQTIGDNYVLMGELRGDLMTTTTNSSQDLRDINELNIDSTNAYLKERQYYALINNCNYYISHIDTAVTKLKNGTSQKYLLPYMAQAKAIRAWTYLNLCLDYGSVNYTTEPILEGASSVTTQTYTLDQLLPVLIPEMENTLALLPQEKLSSDDWTAGYNDPGFTSSVNYDSYAARQLMFPVRFILGDLYLWNKDFAKAAQCYYDLIYMDRLKMSAYSNQYNVAGTTVSTKTWTNQFSSFNYADILSAIVFSTDNVANSSSLLTMANTDYVIAPSSALINIFNSQYYYTNRAISGDLRGLYGTYTLKTGTSGDADAQDAYITKYNYMKASSRPYVATCSSSLIWLRYAEAVNRLGKPKFIFNGFLKYGLCAYNINLYKDKDALKGEVTGESWMDFGQDNPDGNLATIFSSNKRGFHARGCGNTDLNEAYQIEEQATLQDSINWVEDQLVQEYALETSLEGNRFHDLMRISRYRNDPSYLATKVSAKFSGVKKNTIYTKFLDTKNWYLPEKKQ